MQVVFRADASTEIGSGHIMRCLALAGKLAEQGVSCAFICRAHKGNLIDFISEQGFAVQVLSSEPMTNISLDGNAYAQWLGTTQHQDAEVCEPILKALNPDWLVIDHYALDKRWEKALRNFTKCIMVIDDLANRAHDCDILLDQNLGRKDTDYDGLLFRQTQILIGPKYGLLRAEFSKWREPSLKIRVHPKLSNLLITMGGVDQANATGQVLSVLSRLELPVELRITVVMGLTAPWLEKVQVQAAAMSRPTTVVVGVSNMAQLMAESDLCIGGAGGSAWERCSLGLPSVILILSANQYFSAMALQAHDAAWVVSDPKQLMALMSSLFAEVNLTFELRKKSQAAAFLVNGNGTSQVVESLLKFNV